MIHPHTEIRLMSDQFCYGAFATEFIPKGAITFVKDRLDFSISPVDFSDYCEDMQKLIVNNSFIDEQGNRIINVDFPEAIRASADFNTMDTGYGFEIAIEDIHVGEQLTKEYADVKTSNFFTDNYGKSKSVRLERHSEKWYKKLKPALVRYGHLVQPLAVLLNKDMLRQIEGLLQKSGGLNRLRKVSRKAYQIDSQMLCY